MVTKGADVNIPDRYNQTPLYSAVSRGYFDISKLLLEYGANVDILNNVHETETPLCVAARRGYVDICKLLLDHGADVNIHDSYYCTPLWIAAARGNLNISKLLLDHGADVNVPAKSFKTPLYVAAAGGYLGISKLLLDHGADPNITSQLGWTPLTISATNNHYELCKYLLLHTDVDYTKVGKYFGDLLCYASHHGDMELIQKLVQNVPQGDINMKNQNGKTALNVATEEKHYDVSEYLLDQGADINIPNSDVCKNGHLDFVKKWVEKYEADVQDKGCLSVLAGEEPYDVM